MDGPAGNYYPKYESRNPVARILVANFLRNFKELSAMPPGGRVLEVGCGEGHLSLIMASVGREVRGIDISEEIIAEARRNADLAGARATFECNDIYEMDVERYRAPLVVCCEVMEHLSEPERALRILRELARPYLLLSVPREPIWRGLNMARGAYWREWGNTPGHVQHWSKRGFVELVEKQFEIVEVRSPLPWTMVLCR